VGEQAAYLEMRRELLRRNFSEGTIDGQLDELQAWTAQLVADAPEGLAAPQRDPVEVPLDALDDGAAEGLKDPDATLVEPPPAPPTPPSGAEEARAPAPPLPVQDSQPGLPASGFVVSLSRTGWRRLHRLGGCTRHPGVHYLRFELLGEERPRPEDYDDFCRQCWRSGGPEEDSEEEESESEPEEGDAPLLVDEAVESGAAGVAEGL